MHVWVAGADRLQVDEEDLLIRAIGCARALAAAIKASEATGNQRPFLGRPQHVVRKKGLLELDQCLGGVRWLS